METMKETSCAPQRSAKRQIKLVIVVVRGMESFFPYVCDEIAPIVHFFRRSVESEQSEQKRKEFATPFRGGGKT